MSKTVVFLSLHLCLLAGPAFAAPDYLWIGTYSVDDIRKNCDPNGWPYQYYSWYSICPATDAAEKYVNAAKLIVGTKFPNTDVYWHVKEDEENNVTHDILSNIAQSTTYEPFWWGPTTDRGTCDMVIYGGHG